MAVVIPFRKPFTPAARNVVRGSRLHLDAISTRDRYLVNLLQRWRDRAAAAHGLPSKQDLDVLENLDLFKILMGWVHIVDCSPDDPSNYVFRLYASNSTVFRQQNFTLSRLGDIPCPIYADQIQRDYHTARMSGVPLLHLLKTRLNWYETSYSRLVLPLSDNKRDVTQLMICINPRPAPELGELP